ncbi:LytR/AlgR family response regulator transcription factor [Bacteroidota bacterium]
MINCVIIDDEPKAIELLELYVAKVDFLSHLGSFNNSINAVSFIQENKVDLIFLDINMPDLNGIDFLKSISVKPMIVFTTAYSEYAVESYNFEAVDYLLKPILFPRFLKSVSKAQELFQLKDKPVSLINEKEVTGQKVEKIFLKSGTDIHQVLINDILYVEGARNYLFVFTKEKKIMTLMRMKELEDQLPAEEFIRIHKSYIVAPKYIEIIERHQVTIKNKQIPIGRNYREMFLKTISQK